MMIEVSGVNILPLARVTKMDSICETSVSAYKNKCKYFAHLNKTCIFARNKFKSIL